MSEQIVEMLSRLDNLKAMKDMMVLKKKELVDAVITPEVKALLDEINEECDPDLEQATEAIANLEKEIKSACVAHGEKVVGEHMQVIFVKGRASWDGKGLDGYAVAHPEILQFNKVGNPTARLKPTNGG